MRALEELSTSLRARGAVRGGLPEFRTGSHVSVRPVLTWKWNDSRVRSLVAGCFLSAERGQKVLAASDVLFSALGVLSGQHCAVPYSWFQCFLSLEAPQVASTCVVNGVNPSPDPATYSPCGWGQLNLLEHPLPCV